RVCVRRASATIFGGLSLLTAPHVSAKGTASVFSSGTLPAVPSSFVVLDSNADKDAFSIGGGANVHITGNGGGSYTNSSHLTGALSVSNGSSLVADSGNNYVVG